MKLDEIRGKPDGELKNLIDTQREALWKMRFASATEPVDNPGKIRELRREIARIEGEVRARELKVTREKVLAELTRGDKTTREIAKLLGCSIEKAQREAIRLERAGAVKKSRRDSKGRLATGKAARTATGAKTWSAAKAVKEVGGSK